jgi:hypothetical protein
VSAPVAIALGVASAVVYGASSVFQHEAVHREQIQGDVDPHGLIESLRSPKWLIAAGGDVVGFGLQIAALAVGSVVLVQPLVVLMLPVALAVGYLAGGPRPGLADYAACALIGGGLAGFLVLIGNPPVASVPDAKRVATFAVLILIAGLVASLAVTGHPTVVRGAMYGAVGGAFFGTLGVMVDATSRQWEHHGARGVLTTHKGVVPLVAIALLGLGGVVLTQLAFQVGALAATLPANLSADPLTAVLLGGILLGEDLPIDAGHLAGYAICLALVVIGAVRLAGRATLQGRGN